MSVKRKFYASLPRASNRLVAEAFDLLADQEAGAILDDAGVAHIAVARHTGREDEVMLIDLPGVVFDLEAGRRGPGRWPRAFTYQAEDGLEVPYHLRAVLEGVALAARHGANSAAGRSFGELARTLGEALDE